MFMKALEGIRVLDLTHAMAGPICTMFLGAMGAEVIKIEPPWGEMTRMFPPLVKGVSPYFAFLDRNKKGVTLNLKHPKGLDMFKEMVKKSDVVVENFWPGTMDVLGLGWETLRELNPGIIFASISGFGQTGPWSNRRSFDPIAQAASGYMWLMKDSIDPEGPPHQAPEAIADTIPGFSALIGILAALVHRSKTGRGQRIDVAQMDAMIAVSPSFSFWTLARTTFKRAVSGYGVRVSGCHKAKDGYVMFSLPPGRITDWFRELIGMEELTWDAVAAWVAERTVDKVVELLVKAGIPVAPVHDLDDVLANEQARAREMFVKVEHPVLGETTLPGFPIKFSETKGDMTTPAPLLGQHNVEVYSALLGLSEDEVEALRKEGVI
ncbi:CoA transferase [Candidatus Bathyarchaeota archaeon]|nr:MAG: CoA transferase [Candidatus Bathyarchaeota archaeon]